MVAFGLSEFVVCAGALLHPAAEHLPVRDGGRMSCVPSVRRPDPASLPTAPASAALVGLPLCVAAFEAASLARGLMGRDDLALVPDPAPAPTGAGLGGAGLRYSPSVPTARVMRLESGASRRRPRLSSTRRLSESKVTVVPGVELRAEHVARWSAIQRAAPTLASPYFAPEFVRITAAARDDVRVSILEDDAASSGFFPFQRAATASPPRSRQDVRLPRRDRPRLALAWDGRPSSAPAVVGLALRPPARLAEPLRRFQLGRGACRRTSTSRRLRGLPAAAQAGRSRRSTDPVRARKAERQAGRCASISTRRRCAFQALLVEGQQYRATGQPDLTTVPWIVQFLDGIRHERGEHFSGLMSALYLGDRLAAVHLGMRSTDVLHYWLPASTRARLLLPGPALPPRAGASAGVPRRETDRPGQGRRGVQDPPDVRVDLRRRGRGRPPAPWPGAAGRSWFALQDWARRSPLRRPLLGPARWLRRTLAARSAGDEGRERELSGCRVSLLRSQ